MTASKSQLGMLPVSLFIILFGYSLAASESKPADKVSYPNGPPYPVTAAWFRDRFSAKEWNQTLTQFKQQGGDTVFLRAPPIIERTAQDIATDPNFAWCGSYKSSNPASGPRCADEAVQELKAMGLTVSAFATYQYEENFSDSIMVCPKVDRKINSSRMYYRIVLPGKNSSYSPKSPCDFPPGSEVVVLFTSFAGTDPHQLLVETAASQNFSVYFSLPAAPAGFSPDLMPAYYAWVDRVLEEHQSRYTKMKVNNKASNKTLYDTIAGYYGTDESCLAQITPDSPYISLYKALGTAVHSYKKLFAISPYINLNKSQLNSTVEQHVQGFSDIAKTQVVDIIAVQEGRGAAKGSYYWPHQLNQPINGSDPELDRAVHYLDPTLKPNVTYAEVFSASNRELFAEFQKAQAALSSSTPSINFQFWLNLEAFEYLRDDPCLPVDPMASGMGELLNRASKRRLDKGLTVAGAKVQKVISFAWDSDYTCTTNQYHASLSKEILADLDHPMIANCSFHNPHNLSVVVIGFNLMDLTQAFTVEWKDTKGEKRTDNVHGYYFETDYGGGHNLVPSLVYIMLYDIAAMNVELAPVGTVKVSAENGVEPCFYDYSVPYNE